MWDFWARGHAYAKLGSSDKGRLGQGPNSSPIAKLAPQSHRSIWAQRSNFAPLSRHDSDSIIFCPCWLDLSFWSKITYNNRYKWLEMKVKIKGKRSCWNDLIKLVKIITIGWFFLIGLIFSLKKWYIF